MGIKNETENPISRMEYNKNHIMRSTGRKLQSLIEKESKNYRI